MTRDKNLKIYFSGSIRGGRDNVDKYSIIINELKKFGEVLTEFVGDKSLSSYGMNMKDIDIYNKDTKLISLSDIVVAEVTTPSLGVGYEIAYAEKLKKKILCLYSSTERPVSAMIKGNPNIITEIYDTDNIKNILDQFLSK